MKVNDTTRHFLINWLFALAGIASVCFIPTGVSATETVILTVSVNTISYGEFFLKRNEDGILLIRVEDLRHIGLKISAEPITTIDSESYISLKVLSGVSVTLDEKLLLLDLMAGADRVDLPKVVRDFSPASLDYVPSSDTSAFLNYRVDHGNGIDLTTATWSATGQTGLRRGNLLLLGDGYFQRIQNTQQAVRLMTALYWDRPKTTSRWVAGDISAAAGEQYGPVIIGGLGYASAYSMAPGLVTYPLGQFGGVVTIPSEASIYVNGVLVRREHLAPGEYRFQNLPVSNGTNNVEILMRDSFGNESRNSTRFYLSDRLFKAGLHDYSYNIGFERSDFGSSSNHYGQPLLIAHHTFGLNDYLTIGAGTEAGNDLVNIIPKVVLGLSQLGIVTILAAESHDRTLGWGSASGVGYQFQSRYVNYQLSLAYNSREYRTMANRQATDSARLDGGTGFSIGTPSFGTISLNGSYIETYSGLLTRSLGASYSRTLAKSVQFSASMNNSWGASNAFTIFTGLTFFPTHDLTVSASLQTGPGSSKETLTIQKNLPTGEGFGYLMTLDREQTQDQTNLRVNPLLQVNGPYGSYSADLQGQFNEQNWQQRSSSYQVSAAGAMVYAGGHFGLSRPVSGSFATVQVEGVADIKVLLNNQEAARTNANGMAYIPNLQSYQENKISFDDKQIDPNYLIKRYSVVVTPGLFGGKCIYFPAAKVQAYGGRLSELDGEALEYAKVRVQGAEGEFSFTTLSGGEFYFENMADSGNETGTRVEACGEPSPYRLTVVPGHYTGTVAVDGQERHFEIQIPLSDAMFVPLGNIQVPDSEH